MRARRRSRGVSLVEAVVALGIMAFGMLGVAAMQASLRHNADVARQRAEATRMASLAMEQMRAYSTVPVTAGHRAFADPAPADETITGNSAVYTRRVIVNDVPHQRYKSVQVEVSWTDRTNAPQSVQLSSQLHRVPPELTAALMVSGKQSVTKLPGGRHPGIPPSAVPLGDGTSRFTPGGQRADVDPVRSFVFNDTTGVVTLCINCPMNVSAPNLRLVSGYLSFSARGTVRPDAADAERPMGLIPTALMGLTVQIGQSDPGSMPAPICHTYPNIPERVIEYYCFVSTTAPERKWSGRVSFSSDAIAGSDAETSNSLYKICRYTPYTDQAPDQREVGTVQADGKKLRNEDHPERYKDLAANLLNQNYFVIHAGDGTRPFACPADDPLTPVPSGTALHQPPPS